MNSRIRLVQALQNLRDYGLDSGGMRVLQCRKSGRRFRQTSACTFQKGPGTKGLMLASAKEEFQEEAKVGL